MDRFAVLLDLWTNEAAFLENKRQVSNQPVVIFFMAEDLFEDLLVYD